MRPAGKAALQHEVCEPLEQVLDVERIEECALVLLVGVEPHHAPPAGSYRKGHRGPRRSQGGPLPRTAYDAVVTRPVAYIHRMREPGADRTAAIRTALLEFFDASARPLPWRATRDPYAIWISEVMSQQTRVETVVPYYERWLRVFPDVDALANASLDDVLKLWEGLGYYSRARNLHAAARVLRERHAGALPRDYDELRALPGIGEYTAGAVASIAYGSRHPAVDGNVRRVLARLFDQADPTPAALRAAAHALVPHDRPGDFNQAVMELGATICTPRVPKCARCPVRTACAAYRAGTQHERPRTAVRKPIPEITVATAVLRDASGRMLVVRRPARGLLAGLWSFPGAEVQAPGAAASAVAVIAGLHAQPLGPPEVVGTISHTFSHRREHYAVVVVDVMPVGAPGADIAWIRGDTPSVALPRAQQRILHMALAVPR
ncbi:MAG TPA: A/G-specific adenine glycosylase [Longimicrobiales bacterium]